MLLKYYCYEFKLIYVLIVLRGNWVKTDLSVKQCFPIRWEIIIIIIIIIYQKSKSLVVWVGET